MLNVQQVKHEKCPSKRIDSIEKTDNGIEKGPILRAAVGYSNFQFLKKKVSYKLIVIQQNTNMCSKV